MPKTIERRENAMGVAHCKQRIKIGRCCKAVSVQQKNIGH